jgi:drug/metabolite transporter (DMT)-like permease
MSIDKINFYSNIIIWFITSYIFTIYNKKMLVLNDDDNLLFTIGILQLSISILYGVIYFIISGKKIIIIKNFNFNKYLLFGFVTILCHLLSIYATKYNSIIVYQVIKSTEPISIFLQYLLFGDTIHWNKIFLIGLMIFGGLLSSINVNNNNLTFEFNKLGLLYGLLSNFFSSCKLILIKIIMKKNDVNNLSNNSELNLKNQDLILLEYILTNTFSLIIGIPLWYFFESHNIILLKDKLFINYNFTKYLITSGISFYFFNYYSLLIVNETNIIGQIILSVLKKILIIIISFIFFNDKINLFKIIGIIICIGSIIVDFIIQ